jgi:hypothetical protein
MSGSGGISQHPFSRSAPPPLSLAHSHGQHGHRDSGGMPPRRSTRTQHTTLDLTRSSSPDSPSTANSNAVAKGKGKRRSAGSPDVEVVVDIPAPTQRARGAAKDKAKATAHVNAAAGSGSMDADEALARRLQDEEDHDYYNAAAVSLFALLCATPPAGLAVSSARALFFGLSPPTRQGVHASSSARHVAAASLCRLAGAMHARRGETRGLCLLVRFSRQADARQISTRLLAEIGQDAG